MWEQLRRAALGAHCGVEAATPFFDIAEYVCPAVRAPDDVAAELGQLVRQVGLFSVARTCRGLCAGRRSDPRAGTIRRTPIRSSTV